MTCTVGGEMTRAARRPHSSHGTISASSISPTPTHPSCPCSPSPLPSSPSSSSYRDVVQPVPVSVSASAKSVRWLIVVTTFFQLACGPRKRMRKAVSRHRKRLAPTSCSIVDRMESLRRWEASWNDLGRYLSASPPRAIQRACASLHSYTSFCSPPSVQADTDGERSTIRRVQSRSRRRFPSKRMTSSSPSSGERRIFSPPGLPPTTPFDVVFFFLWLLLLFFFRLCTIYRRSTER
ncbi:hypothetical protein F5888DRAFT_1893560, partial [Russula emetica]